MGRRREACATMASVYTQGPPKRVLVTLRTAAGARLTAPLSTLEARHACAMLARAVEAAEADKIAERGAAPKKATKKRGAGGRPSRIKPGDPKPVPRAKRIENAAVALNAVLAGMATADPALQAAMRELESVLGRKSQTRGV